MVKRKRKEFLREISIDETIQAEFKIKKLPTNKKKYSQRDKNKLFKEQYLLDSSKKTKKFLAKTDKKASNARRSKLPKNPILRRKFVRTRLRYDIRLIRYRLDSNGNPLHEYPEVSIEQDALVENDFLDLDEAIRLVRLDKAVKRARRKLFMSRQFKKMSRWILDIDEATYTVFNRFTKAVYARKRFKPVRSL